MKRGAPMALGLAGAIALSTWVVLQITTDIGVLTWLGIAGGAVGLAAGGVAFAKLPKQRLWLAGGALVGAAFAGLIVYQTFFAVSEEFAANKADIVETQQQLDAAFDDTDDDF